ncbi:MAG: hypothetical protein ABI763_13430 [Bacteroidota bacterium]
MKNCEERVGSWQLARAVSSNRIANAFGNNQWQGASSQSVTSSQSAVGKSVVFE